MPDPLHVRQTFEDASGCKCAMVLNKTRYYMQGLHRVLCMSELAQNASIILQVCLNMPLSLNMPEHDWILLDLPEDAWKSLNKQFQQCQDSQYTSSSEILDSVLNMPQALSMAEFWIFCDIIIIVTLLLLL